MKMLYVQPIHRWLRRKLAFLFQTASEDRRTRSFDVGRGQGIAGELGPLYSRVPDRFGTSESSSEVLTYGSWSK
jgi:hypothetical protein